MKRLSLTPAMAFRVIVLLAASFELTPQLANAASATWNAAPSNNNWLAAATTNNWSTGDGTFPGQASSSGTGDVATFSNASSITTISNNVGFSIGGILFDTANASAYTIYTSGGTWRINNGSSSFIRINSTVVNPQVINGALRMASTGPVTVTSDSTTPTATLSIANGISVNNSGNGATLILTGQNTGPNVMASFTEQTPATIFGALTKSGSGTWILVGNCTYHSNTLVSGGILMLAGNGAIPNSTNMWVNSGTLCISNTMVNPNNLTVTNGGSLLLTNTFFRTPLTIGNLIASNAIFRVGLNGSTPYTNILATNSLNLGVNVTIGIEQVAAVSAPTSFNLISYAGADPNPANISVTTLPGYLAGAPTVDTVNKLVQVTVTPTALPVSITWQGSVSSGDWDTTTPNWTNSAGASVSYNQNDFVTFDDTAVTTAVKLTTTLSPGAFTNNTAGTYTFGGPGKISGAASLIKLGTGTLIFTNAANNDYNGGTVISGGTVQVGNGTTLGSIPASASVVNNGALIFDRSDSLTVGAPISGSGSLSQIGGGTLTLSGSSSFTGGLTLSQGAVRANAVTASGTGLVTVNSGATFVAGAAVTNGFALSNAIVGTTVTLTMNTNKEFTVAPNSTNLIYSADPQNPASSQQFLIDGNLRGSGTVVIINALVQNIDGGQGVRFRNTNAISDFSGTIIYTNGNKGELLTMTQDGASYSPIGTGKLILYAGNYLGTNGTLALADGTGYTELNIRNNGAGSVNIGNDITIMGTGAAIINGLAGSNGVTMGKLTIGAGQELIGYKASAAPAVTNVLIFPTVSLGGSATFSPHSTSFGATSQFGTDFSLGAITETVAGSGITKGGLGAVSLTGVNNYSGNTTVTNGTLFLKGSASIANSPNIIIGSGGVLDVTNLSSTFTLGPAQTLSNITSTAAMSGNADASLGAISLRYASGVPSFTVSNGALTVASGTTFKVNNTGVALPKGNYKLISAANGGSVAGTAPSTVTVGGNGVTGTGSTTLQITGGELFLVTPNTAPTIARIVPTSVAPGLTWKIPAAALATAAGWADVDSDTLTITAAGPTSTLGKSVTQDGSFIYYNAAVTGEDHFSYTISDGTATANGTIYLESSGPPPAPANASLIVPGGNGVPTITFAGIPGRTNVVEASTNLVDWNEISTNIAGTNGLWKVIDNDATNFLNRYYRSYQVYP
jgi:fibronectin-binding autotransporter adhesin